MSAATTAATAEDIREGIATALKAIPGLQASAYLLGNPTPPFAQVLRGPVTYDQAMSGGVHRWTMTVRAYVALVSDIGAQKLLDEFLAAEGSRSIKAAIEEDTTLDGAVSDLHVTGASGEQEYVREQGGPLLGSEWNVDVWL